MNTCRVFFNRYQKYLFLIAIGSIIVWGVYLRIVNHEALLVFKSDQARDAIFIDSVLYEGAHLPLLGPQVGGTVLRLGPIFYYFQLLSGKVFGSSPESLAYPDLLWGILFLPIFYLLLRKFFTKGISLWLLGLASSSLLLVTFSRFAWNPNGLPFFTALFAYAFLEALELRGKRRWLLLSLAAFCIGIVANLHLAAILGLSLGLLLFLVLTRSLSWQEVVLMVGIVAILHTPVLVNEWQTKGELIRSFVEVKEKKITEEKGHAVYEKFFRAYQEGSSMSWLLLTGQQNTSTILTKGFELKCDKKCKADLWYSVGAMILFGYILSISLRKLCREDEKIKKIRIVLIGCWFGSFFIVTILLAYQLQTRFYLGVVVPLFILLGFGVEYLYNFYQNTWWKWLMVGVGVGIIFLNVHTSKSFLVELNRSQVSSEESGKDLRFGTEPKVTLGQLRTIALDAENKLDKNIPIIIFGESHYVKALYYVMSRERGFNGCYIKGKADIENGYNTLFLMENKSRQGESSIGTLFGTLASEITRGTGTVKDLSLPKDCLDY